MYGACSPNVGSKVMDRATDLFLIREVQEVLMLSLPRYYLRLLVHSRPLVSVAVSGDRHSVSYSPLGSARSGPDPNLLIRRSGHIVQDRLMRYVRWADIPELAMCGRRCPPSWQQYWQQSRRAAP
jgi:hypothetical protein